MFYIILFYFLFPIRQNLFKYKHVNVIGEPSLDDNIDFFTDQNHFSFIYFHIILKFHATSLETTSFKLS